MSKPDDIPQDVWDAAMTVAVEMEIHAALSSRTDAKADVIARAIIAAKAEEREACYQEALDEAGRWMSDDSNRNESFACSRVAAAIRKRGEVNTAYTKK